MYETSELKCAVSGLADVEERMDLARAGSNPGRLILKTNYLAGNSLLYKARLYPPQEIEEEGERERQRDKERERERQKNTNTKRKTGNKNYHKTVSGETETRRDRKINMDLFTNIIVGVLVCVFVFCY